MHKTTVYRLSFGVLLFVGQFTNAAERVDYLRDIKPVLTERCYACHGALQQQGGLRLDTVSLMKQGGDRGPAIVAGKSSESILIDHLLGKPGARRMPPKGEGEPLKPDEIARIRAWIDQGATGPADEKPEPDPRDHWAFKVPVRPPLPRLKNTAGIRNPIDAFLAREHENLGLRPQPEADRRVLLRRLYLDLIGLPPTLEEQQAFLADPSPRAYEKVVERLLSSKQYGERWGRHWMDIWRYSDWWGLGDEVRNSQKHIWHWRDWILDSLNADKGYDQMIREMLAADELYPTDTDRLRATGYLARQYFKFNRNTWLEEVVEHTSKAFLGLTMNCTKCHDHKYDPFSQEDFYRFRAFFEPYQVRTDMVPGISDYEKDGIPRVFDCNLDAPTYVFVRGDERQPRKSKSIKPGLPALLAPRGVSIQPVSLPAEAYYPGLRPHVVDTLASDLQNLHTAAQAQLAQARKQLAALEQASKVTAQNPVKQADPLLLKEDFARLLPDRWETREGKWTHSGGKLVQEQIGASRGVLRLRSPVPRDFQATLRFTPTGGQTWKSVGITFDAGPAGEVLVYLSAYAGGAKLQVAYKQQSGEYVYPPEATQPREVKLGVAQELTLRIRDRLLNVAVGGKHALAYHLPIARREGAVELITYDARAEFHSFELRSLPADAQLTPAGKGGSSTVQTVAQARAAVILAEKTLARLAGELASLKARAAADRARYQNPPASDAPQRIAEAVRAEREVAVLVAEEALARAELEANQAKITAAKQQLEIARKNRNAPGGEYTPIRGSLKTLESNLESEASRNKPFPTTSTGRRSALAQWLTAADNPLTARVAVNHIWARHFGQPLVATVFDFGRKGAAPTHPELLDWLAVELRENNWSMKHLHRLIVTSAAYRRSSSTRGATDNLARDPENRYLWRMNAQRMQSEVIRDSLLHLAGNLDLTMGGPSIPITQESRRRSLYFVHSHNDQHKFLSIFDNANVLDCYRRAESIIPQQALALSNSRQTQEAAEQIARRLLGQAGLTTDEAFIRAAFETVLATTPTEAEQKACREALAEWRKAMGKTTPPAANGGQLTEIDVPLGRALVLALLNHNDFVTIR